MGSVKISLAISVALLALVAGSGCSSVVTTHGSRPCSRSSPPAGCGAMCSAGTSCPAGLYCDPSSHCTADCDVVTGSGCATGEHCGSDGRCGTTMDGSITPPTDFGPPIDYGPVDNTCASVSLGTTRVTPNVVLLVDQSGSMHDTFDMGMTRWQTLYNALMGAGGTPGGLVYSLQDSARFGFVAFTGQTSFFGGGMCPQLHTVLPPVLHNYDTINATYMPLGPDSNTPTGAALDSVVTTLALSTLEPGPTIILLCTDGEPNTCADSGDMAGGQAQAITAAMRAQDLGFTVDAIGVASDVALANLQMVAMAGGGTAVSVTDTSSLVAALTSIVGGAVSCTLELSGMIDPTMACGGDVELNGMPLACSDPNGWVANDMNHITLQGTACDTLLHTSGATVTATFPCGVLLH